MDLSKNETINECIDIIDFLNSKYEEGYREGFEEG